MSDEAKVNLHTGPKFEKIYLTIDNNQRKYLANSSGTLEKTLLLNSFTPKNIASIIQKTESNLLNAGYAFATVRLDSIRFENENLYAHLRIVENNKIIWGDIQLKGTSALSHKLLRSFLHIKSGEIFKEEQLTQIPKQLSQLPFIIETKPLELLFYDNKVDIYLFLNSKPISQITGVLGLQPKIQNNLTTYVLTGDIRAKLVNTLKRGENIDLQWKNLQANTQLLKTNLAFPSVFKSSFGAEGQFQLYKKDTTFLELKSAVAIQHMLSNGNICKLFYRNYQSTILNSNLSNSATFSNVQTNYFGISIQKQTLDYLPSPTKGYLFQLEGAIGIRNKKDSILQTNIQTSTSKVDLLYTHYLPIHKRHIIKLLSATELLTAPNFAKNELLRFGGMVSQRGFKEEELRATSRILLSVEYRFLLDQNSFIFLFFDQSLYENKLASIQRDTPYGFGGGLTFGTQIGMFSISYALGKQLNNPILISNGNIHFGYTSYF